MRGLPCGLRFKQSRAYGRINNVYLELAGYERWHHDAKLCERNLFQRILPWSSYIIWYINSEYPGYGYYARLDVEYLFHWHFGANADRGLQQVPPVATHFKYDIQSQRRYSCPGPMQWLPRT